MRIYHGTDDNRGESFDLSATPSDIGCFFTPNAVRLLDGDFVKYTYIYVLEIDEANIYEVSQHEADSWLETHVEDADERWQLAANVAGELAFNSENSSTSDFLNEMAYQHGEEWGGQAIALRIAEENGYSAVIQNDEYGDSISTNRGIAHLLLIRNENGNFKRAPRV